MEYKWVKCVQYEILKYIYLTKFAFFTEAKMLNNSPKDSGINWKIVMQYIVPMASETKNVINSA